MPNFTPGKRLKDGRRSLITIPQEDFDRVIAERVRDQLPKLVEQRMTVHASYSGPLPPAAETKRFEEILPGFTDRWVAMSEKEQAERFSTTRRRDWMEITYKMVSLLCGFVIVAGLIWAGVDLLRSGKSAEGFSSIGIAAAAIIAAVINRSRKKKVAGKE